MGKPKHRHGAKSANCSTSTVFPESDPDLDVHGENGWVVVKRQRVIILVPSLPANGTSEETRVSPETDLRRLPLKQVPRTTTVNANKVYAMSRMTIQPPLSFYSRSGLPLNQGLRAVNLERKLRRAGGLSRWLVSLGLEQFARLFRRKGLGRFHVVNLTMKKLKEMGAEAVGPRRKLMHAIDCICQPHCFATAF